MLINLRHWEVLIGFAARQSGPSVRATYHRSRGSSNLVYQAVACWKARNVAPAAALRPIDTSSGRNVDFVRSGPMAHEPLRGLVHGIPDRRSTTP